MKINVNVDGKDRFFDSRSMESQCYQGRWELLMLATEGEETFPKFVGIVILASDFDRQFIANLEKLIVDRGGVSSNEEFLELMKQARKEKEE